MEICYEKFKSEKCNSNCSDILCEKYHSNYDCRRPNMNYSSIICIDAVKNGYCSHQNCRSCINYTEYLYHKNNYKTRKCIAVTIGAECLLQSLCPYSHTPNDRNDFLEKLKNAEKSKAAAKTQPKVNYVKKTEVVENKSQNEEVKIEQKKSEASVNVPPQVKQTYFHGYEVQLFEDRYNEFKECKSRNFDISYACNLVSTYVSAFLNTEGGIIYYGISDSGYVSGVKLPRKNRDLFTQNFDNILNKFRPPVGPELYSVSFEPVYSSNGTQMQDTYVIEILVKKGDIRKIYYTHKEEAFIKRDSSVSQLKGPSLVEFSKNRE